MERPETMRVAKVYTYSLSYYSSTLQLAALDFYKAVTTGSKKKIAKAQRKLYRAAVDYTLTRRIKAT